MNSCNFVGYIASNIKTGTSQGSGTVYASFKMCVKRTPGNMSALIKVIAFGKIVDAYVTKYLKKGDMIALSAEANTTLRKLATGDRVYETYFVLKEVNRLNIVAKDEVAVPIVKDIEESDEFTFDPE